MPLNSKIFGLTGGILVSLTLFATVWHALLTDQGFEFLKIWADMHYWYELVPLASPLGSLVSLADGFSHGFIFLFIFAILYNWLERKNKKTETVN